ncbi:hypothetical protein DPMN_140968 [Dreissena polymorpha]|uniref:Uncharacterized protein n=1 Tax=Dreissena polymorpha TaxID=45954 RepID=A0A9D4GBW4_DREPO|nr:hypothetical protein DPMN_140968 [Dreissena polymorpha]
MNTELCTSKRTGVMAVSMMVLMTLSHAVSTCMNSMLSIIRLLWRWYIVVRVAREELPDLDLPPGDMGFPFIGETMDFLNDVSRLTLIDI